MTFDHLCGQIDAEYASGQTDAMLSAVRQLAIRRLRGNEDAAQDVVIAVMEGLEHYELIAPFNHWVQTIIKNKKHDTLKTARREAYLRPNISDLLPRLDADGVLETYAGVTDRIQGEAFKDGRAWDDYFGTLDRVKELHLAIQSDPFMVQVARGVIGGRKLIDIAATMNVTLDSLKGRLKRFRRNRTRPRGVILCSLKIKLPKSDTFPKLGSCM